MKPAVFIGSSAENSPVAYAVQEELERDVEPTVWSQGLFAPTKSAMESLFDVVESTDYAVFVFAPDDVVKIRGVEMSAARDNVVFEIGLFMGRLGRERVFLLVPRGCEDLRLPTDLAGVTPAEYEPDRQDENLVAAVGPACNRIKRAIAKFGKLDRTPEPSAPPPVPPIELNVQDIMTILQSWMGGRTISQNTAVIRFRDVDNELGLPIGSAAQYIELVALQTWSYTVARRGNETILFARPPNASPWQR